MSDAQPPFAGDDAILAHGRAGLVVTVSLFEADGTTERDVSSADLFFEIEGVVRVETTNGAETHQKVITLSRAQVQAIGINARKLFVLVNETADPPACEWSGAIRVVGFLTQPS
ncbi:MAG: hypothetical protein GC206_13435 [Alphaproteobacteria bacterium]|nr:hypothetical protein [Alphaproteobacteria bacterium]